MNTVLAIDPGYRVSAFVLFDGARIGSHGIRANEEVLSFLRTTNRQDATLVLESMQLFSASHGVGREIFDSVFWSGRFAQAWSPRPFERLLRSKVRSHLHAQKGGDAAVRASLVDRFGPYKEKAIGKKSSPGPLFGIRADEWSALALAVTWWDLQQQGTAGAAVDTTVAAAVATDQRTTTGDIGNVPGREPRDAWRF